MNIVEDRRNGQKQDQAEEALANEAGLYRGLASVMPAAVYTCDMKGVITFYNRRAAELWGREPRVGDTDEKFCGSYRLFRPGGTPLPHDQTPMAIAVKTGQPAHDEEVVIERPDGSFITVNVNIVPIFDEEGRRTGAINVFQDVSERRRLWEENRQQRELLERIVGEVPAAIAFLEGPEHRFTLANPAYRAIARGKGELVGRTVAEVWPEVVETIIPLLDEVFHEDKPFQATEMPLPVLRDKGPETIYITFSIIPMHNATGQVQGILIMAVETTDHVLARKQIETEKALLAAILTQMPSGVMIAEAPSGKLLMGNKQLSKIWRHAQSPATGIDEYGVYEGFHPDRRPYGPAEWPLARSITKGDVVQNEEIVFKRGDETYGVMSIASAPVVDEEGQIVAGVAVFNDITERKQAESLLRGQIQILEMVARGAELSQILEALTRVVEQQSPDAAASILLLDEAGRLRHGAAPSLPDEYNQAMDGLAIDPGVGTCCAAAARAEVVVTPDIATDPQWQGLSHLPLSVGLKAAWSMPILARDGKVLGTLGTYFQQRRVPAPAERQAVELLVHTAAMAIERKQAEAERERLLLERDKERAQLRELAETLEVRVLERTAQVRDLASALNLAEQRERARISQVLHDDLQQLLYSQLMRLEVLRRTLPAEQQASMADLISGMVEQLDQAVHVTRGLAAELNPPKMESNNLCEALQWLARHMEENHGLKVMLAAQGPTAINHAETRSVLLQIVRELLFNVVKHADTTCASLNVCREDNFLVINIEDNGVGFDLEAVSASLKEQGSLGLFTISDRLALIGGRLEIDSAPGAGTRVTIFAPAE